MTGRVLMASVQVHWPVSNLLVHGKATQAFAAARYLVDGEGYQLRDLQEDAHDAEAESATTN